MQPKNSSRMFRKPLYQQAADLIQEDYIQGKTPGLRLPSEAELEKILGVSMVTVRAAMRELEVRQLVDRRPGSGTYIAEERPSPQHTAILLDVDISSENLSPFWLKWVHELQKAFRTEGIPYRSYLGKLPLGTPPSENITCQELLDDVSLGRINGIAGYFVSQNPYWGTSFIKRGIPVLDLGYSSKRILETSIRSIFAHFQQHNRNHIAVIGWESPSDGRYSLSKEIFALAPEYGITLDDSFINMTANAWEYGMGWESFRDIWRATTKKPEGLFVVDDMLFDDCQKAISELGISVPEDLSVAVSTSDVHRFQDIRFPFFAWKLITPAHAKNYAKAMKALLGGASLPGIQTIPFDAQMLLPDTMDPQVHPPHDFYGSPQFNI